MTTRVLVLVGTRRGAFIFESSPSRAEWKVRGPLAHSGWSFSHLHYDPHTGTLYAAGHDNWYGAAVWRSQDLGQSWQLSSEGITYGDDGPSVKAIWQIHAGHGTLYAGIDPAGLFRSDDGGVNWARVEGLHTHPDRSSWRPGRAGIPLHSIITHPTDAAQLWVSIAGGGVLHSNDGGCNWAACNGGTGGDGLMVQKLVMAAGDPNRFYQQHRHGVYSSRDGCRTWSEITEGLPTDSGFAIAAHPHNPEIIYTVPTTDENRQHLMPGGRIAIWRSQNGGGTWERLSRGLPDAYTYCKVLREGLAVDHLDPAGIYFGTSTGHLFGSRDEGETWFTLAEHLAPVYSVSTAVIE